MHIDGRCHCGHVTFEAEVDPEQVSLCHCTDCQHLTGSAFRTTVFAARDDLRLTGNPPKLYTKRGDNGRARLQYFCSECGSPLFTTGEGEDAKVWGIRWGNVVQRDQLTPKRQIWCQSAVPWLSGIASLPGTGRDG